MVGVVFWGMQRAIIPSVFAAIIADNVSDKIVGTAIGLQSFFAALVVTASSFYAGYLAIDNKYFSATFLYGLIMSLIALLFAMLWKVFVHKKMNIDKQDKELKAA